MTLIRYNVMSAGVRLMQKSCRKPKRSWKKN